MPGHDPETLRKMQCLPGRLPEDFDFRGHFTEHAPLRRDNHGLDPDTAIAYCDLLDTNLGGEFPRYPKAPWALTFLAAGAKRMKGKPGVPHQILRSDADAAIARLNSPLFD